MRVTYFLSEFPKLSETFILDQIEGLLDLGEDVRIVALGQGDRPVHPSIARRGLLERTTYLPPIPASRARRLLGAVPRLLGGLIGTPSLVGGALRADRYGRLASSLELLYRATTADGALDGDVVHCHYGPMGRLAVILRELGVFAAPVLTTFHGYDLRLAAERGPTVFEPLQRQADAVIAISRFSRARLLAAGFTETSIIDHPVGVELGSPAVEATGRRSGETPGELRLLTVARLVPEKGLAHALDALAAVRDRRPRAAWTYRIVGGGPLDSVLRERIERLALDDHVQLAGPLDREAVREELSAADLFVLPSEAEVLPLAAMEAHAFALPVVASDVGAIGEIVEHGESGWLVPAGNAVALGAALEQLFDDAALRERFGRRGRQIVEQRFEIGRLNGQLQRILHELCGGTDGFRSAGSRVTSA